MMKTNFTRCGLTFAAAALLILVAAAPAAAATQTFRSQDSYSVFVSCANGGSGESVDGIVKVHAVFGVTDDGAGGSMNGAFNFNVDAIGMGDAPNFHGTFRMQVTYNANGVLTMDKGVFT